MRRIAAGMGIPAENLVMCDALEGSLVSAGGRVIQSESIGPEVLDGFSPRGDAVLALTRGAARIARLMAGADYRMLGVEV